jgi:1,4-dihydroxy-2-naphthoyl-CoA hydrolase
MIARWSAASWSNVGISEKGNFKRMPTDPPVAVPFENTLDGKLGWEVLETAEDRASARFEVEDKHRQPMGLVHGGVYAALAEGLCSMTTWMQVTNEGKAAVGSSNLTSFLRPVKHGTVTANARAIHRGRTTWVWEVEFTNDDQKLCAVSRVTLAVISI